MTNKDGSDGGSNTASKQEIWMTYSLGELELKKCNKERQ